MDMDQEDEHCGRTKEIHQRLHSAYCQVRLTSVRSCKGEIINHPEEDKESIQDPEVAEASFIAPMFGILIPFRLPLESKN